MQTDIILNNRSQGKRIVIDTKFTTLFSSGRFRSETLRSGYIYQIYAYLMSQVGKGDPLADNASGLLLHSAIGESVSEEVVIQDHIIRFATVDLTASDLLIVDSRNKLSTSCQVQSQVKLQITCAKSELELQMACNKALQDFL